MVGSLVYMSAIRLQSDDGNFLNYCSKLYLQIYMWIGCFFMKI